MRAVIKNKCFFCNRIEQSASGIGFRQNDWHLDAFWQMAEMQHWHSVPVCQLSSDLRVKHSVAQRKMHYPLVGHACTWFSPDPPNPLAHNYASKQTNKHANEHWALFGKILDVTVAGWKSITTTKLNVLSDDARIAHLARNQKCSGYRIQQCYCNSHTDNENDIN